MTDEQRLQAHLALMTGEPIAPLSGMQSVSQALRLRSAGLTYEGIARVMRLYHGDSRTSRAWRSIMRSNGAAPKHHSAGPRVAPHEHKQTGHGQ